MLEMRQVKGFLSRLFSKRASLKTHTLSRYIAHEMLLYFAVCFLFFFLVFFVNQMLLMAENVLKKRVPLLQVARLVVYCMPFVIAQSAPFATLVGFLMCAARMVSQSEVVVMRSSGISYFAIALPALAVSLAISAASFFVNDYLLPLGTVRYNALYRKILMSNPAVELESRAVKKMNEATLITGDVSGESASSVVLIDMQGRNTRIVSAGRSRLAPGKESGVLMRLEMAGVRAIVLDTEDGMTFDEVSADNAVLNIFDTAFFGRQWAASPREMTSLDLHRKIAEMERGGETSERTLNRYRMEMQKKIAQPLGSLFFALLALPLALLTAKRGGQTAGMVSGVLISVVYWAVMIIGQIAAGRLGFNAFVCVWTAPFAVGAIGLLLSWRAAMR